MEEVKKSRKEVQQSRKEVCQSRKEVEASKKELENKFSSSMTVQARSKRSSEEDISTTTVQKD